MHVRWFLSFLPDGGAIFFLTAFFALPKNTSVRTKPIQPKPLNATQQARAIAFHTKKLTAALDVYSDAVFKAWVLINSTLDLKRDVRIHMDELCRITKGTHKCR